MQKAEYSIAEERNVECTSEKRHQCSRHDVAHLVATEHEHRHLIFPVDSNSATKWRLVSGLSASGQAFRGCGVLPPTRKLIARDFGCGTPNNGGIVHCAHETIGLKSTSNHMRDCSMSLHRENSVWLHFFYIAYDFHVNLLFTLVTPYSTCLVTCEMSFFYVCSSFFSNLFFILFEMNILFSWNVKYTHKKQA